MQFTKRLRDGVRRGDITTSIRIWQKLRVKVGSRYAMDGGYITVTAIRNIEITDITPRLGKDSGFDGVVDLLKTAKHGRGERVYLIEFVYDEER